METTTEVSDKLLLENITERVETTHESYQSTSVDGTIMEESRTVVFQSTQETVTTVEQNLGNNSFYPSVNENTSILEHKYEVNSFSSDKTDSVLLGNVIENDPDLMLTADSESDVSLVVNEKVSDNTGVNVISNIALSPDKKNEANEYMLEEQSENVYMPEHKDGGASEQVYATEMISDDSQDDIFPNEAEQAPTEDVNVPKAEEDTAVDKKDENIDLDTKEQSLSQESEQDPLKCETAMAEFVGVEENRIEIIQDDTVEEEVMNVQGGEEVKDETAVSSAEQTENDKVEEMDTSERVTETVEASGTSNEVDLNDVPTTSSESVTLQNYSLPEGLEVTEIQEGEYQTEQGNSDGTLVLLQDYEHAETFEEISEEETASQMSDDQQEGYMKEIRGQAESRQSTSSTSSGAKPKRGRKPTYDIPMHVLGHDISKPVEAVQNGRAPPKPRLGVKVPYRNLTSQIVSKAEIEKEVMQRAKLKQEQALAKGDVLFARKLTQRLARKIAPSPNHPKKVLTPSYKAKVREQKSPEKETELTDPLALEPHEISAGQEETQKINNDSDLLAILEGEGDDMPVLPKEVPQPIHDDADVKMLEREIALQQLQELPHQEPTQRVFRGRQARTEARAPVLTAEATALSKTKTAEKAGSAAKQSSPSALVAKKADVPPSNKENTSRHSKESPVSSPRKEQVRIDLPMSPKKGNADVEPQVKVNMVLKTYSRKRKTVELPEPFPESPSPKRPTLADSEGKMDRSEPQTDVYVTKSSRVIKKKVIWDPDEITVRSPRPMRADSPAKTVKHSERLVEKKTPTEKTPKEKSPEKRQPEKPLVKKVHTEKSTPPAEKKPSKTESPKNSKTPVKSKKSLSEVDRLLMDEGAVKMLYDLKNTDDAVGKKKKDVYSVERAQKELMKKANEIKNDLQQTTSSESPKSLRKKAEGFPAALLKPALIASLGERKMSKDSTRSSLHTPPGSPAYGQGSMLVRRRSSSSISSGDEAKSEDNVKVRRKSGSDTQKSKKVKRYEEPQEEEAAEKVGQPKAAAIEAKPNQFKSFAVKKSNKHVTIDLRYTDNMYYCTAEMLEELTIALKKFAKDKDCNVVSITSSSKVFCSGLDYASLVSSKEDVRKKLAVELSGRVKEFLLCLLNFPKVLVAGIKGECVGLGVTMLPLFDVVIASDTATFSTPYASLGCVAEAGFLLSSPHLTNHGLAAELLFTTQKLTADDVFRRGLISRLCWPEKYNETLKTILTSISNGSKQSLESTKKQLRRHLVQSTEAAINAESKLLVEHWTSAECQKSFARLAEQNGN